MSPNSPESRILALERQVAKLEQRVEDLLERLEERFKTFDDDVRAFAPMLKDIVQIQTDLRHIHDDLAEHRLALKQIDTRLTESIDSVVGRLDSAAKALSDRLDAEELTRQQKAKEEKRDKWMRVATLGALVGTFVSSTTAVLALLL